MINQEQFEDWLESPVTQQVRKYLLDSALQEKDLVVDAITDGAIIDEKEQGRISTMIYTLNRIAELDFEEIEDFYTVED